MPRHLKVIALLFCALCCVMAQTALADFERGPYVLAPRSDSLAIVWMTQAKEPSMLRYSSGARRGRVVKPQPTTLHVAKIGGLKPGETVRYEVFLGANRPVRRAVYRTAPPETANATVRFAVIGDTGGKNGVQSLMAKGLRNWGPELLLHTGDFVYPFGYPGSFEAQYFAPFQKLIASIPVFPVRGNHDARRTEYYDRAFPVFVNRVGNALARYYSVNYSNLHITAVDTAADYEPGTAQYAWLERDLAQYAGRNDLWRVVIMHHPPFSDGEFEGSPNVREFLVPLFDKYDVDIVFCGHVHAYQRIAPFGDNPDGHKVQYVTTGGGAKRLTKRGTTSDTTVRYEEINHFLGVTATAEMMQVVAQTAEGDVVDSFELRKGS